MLQCVSSASDSQCVASKLQRNSSASDSQMSYTRHVCCSVLQCVAACCSVLQCVAAEVEHT
jgi:hypothetical protein